MHLCAHTHTHHPVHAHTCMYMHAHTFTHSWLHVCTQAHILIMLAIFVKNVSNKFRVKCAFRVVGAVGGRKSGGGGRDKEEVVADDISLSEDSDDRSVVDHPCMCSSTVKLRGFHVQVFVLHA